MCTLHSFPHNIDHCLTFARSEFEGLLEKSPAEANAFLLDPAKCVVLQSPSAWSTAAQRTPVRPGRCDSISPARVSHVLPLAKLSIMHVCGLQDVMSACVDAVIVCETGTWMRQ